LHALARTLEDFSYRIQVGEAGRHARLDARQLHLQLPDENHAAETIPGLEFWSVREHSLADIWQSSPAFNAFLGTDWMKEPCASCPRRFEDFGGCRCQALALTGDARAADPVCHLSSHHALMAELADQRDDAPYIYRRQRTDRITAAENALVER
jgi:radical SAM protein with 4Fe4S-binding SPASM domain